MAAATARARRAAAIPSMPRSSTSTAASPNGAIRTPSVTAGPRCTRACARDAAPQNTGTSAADPSRNENRTVATSCWARSVSRSAGVATRTSAPMIGAAPAGIRVPASVTIARHRRSPTSCAAHEPRAPAAGSTQPPASIAPTIAPASQKGARARRLIRPARAARPRPPRAPRAPPAPAPPRPAGRHGRRSSRPAAATADPSTAVTEPRTIASAWAAAAAGSSSTDPSRVRERSEPSASYARSANASSTTCSPTARPASTCADPASPNSHSPAIDRDHRPRDRQRRVLVAGRPVVQRAMRLHVAQRHARRPGRRPDGAHLDDDGPFDLVGRQRHRPPPEAGPIRVARVRADRDAVARGDGHGPGDDVGIAGVGAARDVDRGHERDERLVLAQRPRAVRLADIGVEVDPHGRDPTPPSIGSGHVRASRA